LKSSTKNPESHLHGKTSHADLPANTVRCRILQDFLDALFFRVWWQWSPLDVDVFSTTYHWFNILEGLAWFVFSWLVYLRWRRHGHSSLEIWYSIAFCCFGMTDIVEAWQQSSLLIWVKLIILVLLLRLRRTVMRRFYPESKLY
jgi:hypothetical protein